MNGNETPHSGQFCLNSGILALGMAHAIRCVVNAEQNFSPGQLAWARSHDWFISGNLSEIVCRNEWIKDGTRHEETVKHTNFRKLREWAGY